MNILDSLEKIKSKIMYVVIIGHQYIPVSRLMLLVNKITRILGHSRPLEYTHEYENDSILRKTYDTLDSAYSELDKLLYNKQKMIDVIGKNNWEDLNNLLSELSYARDRCHDAEFGPGASLKKRGRRFQGLTK